MKAPEKRLKMKAFTGFAIGTLAVLGAVAAVFIYLKKKTEKEIAYDQFDDIMDSDEDFDDEFFDDDDEVLDPAEVMNKPEEEKAEDAAEAETAEEKEPEAELCALLLQLYLLIEVLCQPGLCLCLLLRAHFKDNLCAQVILHIGNLKQLLLIKHIQNASDAVHII